MKCYEFRLLFFFVLMTGRNVLLGAPVDTLPDNRLLTFNDYTLTNAPNAVWRHEGGVPGSAQQANRALLAGTNHFHAAGWRLFSCRAGSAAYLGFSIPPKQPATTPTYPAVATNLAANLRYERGALIDSPVVTNGVGTIYFEAINNQAAYPGQVTVEIATNMVDVNTSEVLPTVAPPSTNNLEYLWVTLDVLDLNAATSNEFVRYSRLLNFRGPVKMRIRRTGDLNVGITNPDYAFIVIDNIRLSFPPSDVAVSVSDTPFEPGYPSLRTNLCVRCRVDNADTNVPTDARALKLVYRWRFLSQQAQAWQTNAMSLVAGTGDGLGNGELYEVSLPPFAEVGDLEYYFICDFDGPVYVSPDYTGTGLSYPYASEGLSPRTLRSDGGEPFSVRLRPYASPFGQLFAETDMVAEPVAMTLVGDNEWRALVPVMGAGATNLSWRFKAQARYVSGSGAFSTGVTCWAASGGGLRTLPCAGTCVETNAGEALSASLSGGNYLVLTFNTDTLGYTARRGEFQSFNYWPAPPTLFTDSNEQEPKRIDTETFDTWPLSQSQSPLQAFAGYPFTTNVYSYSAFLTLPPLCVAGSAAYVSERTMVDNTINAPVGATKFRNVAMRLLGGNGALGLGYLHSRTTLLPDGLKEVTFKARLAQTADNYDICYYRNGFTNLNYLVRGAARAVNFTCVSPQNPSVSLVGYYRDPDNFYEYRVVQVNDPADTAAYPKDKRISHQLYKWKNGAATRVGLNEQTMAVPPLLDPAISESAPLEMAFFNETNGTRVVCRFGNPAAEKINFLDSASPHTCGTFGYFSEECGSQLYAVRTTGTVSGGTGYGPEVYFLASASFSSDILNWYLPSGRYIANAGVTPKGIYSVVPSQSLGVYVQPTVYGSEGEPVGPGGAAWQLCAVVSVSNYTYQTTTVPLRSWQSQFVMLQVLDGASDVVVDELGVTSWHGACNGAGHIDETQWVADESWVVTNAGAEATTLYLEHSRGDPSQEQALRSPLLERGMGVLEFDYRVLRGPALLRVQYALKRSPSEWIDLKAFVTNAATGWLHAAAFLGQDEAGFFRVLNAREGIYTNAWVEIDNASAADEPDTGAGVWKAYNAKISDADLTRVPLDESRMCALNNSPTLEASPVQDQSDPFVQTPGLPGGLGELTFSARAYSNAQPATVYVYATTNGWGAPSNQWFEVARFENISNTLYHTLSYRPLGFSGAPYDAVRLMTRTGAGARRVCLDDIAVAEPLQPSFDIVNVRVLCSENGGAYSASRFQPLVTDDVGVEAQVANIQLVPSNIQMYVTYYVGTAVWGADHWPAGQTVTKPLVPCDGNPLLYRTSESDDLPPQVADQVVQYRVWASYWGDVPLTRSQETFDRPSWYDPVDLNQVYAGQGWSPYYIVYGVQTATQTTPVAVPYAWLDLYPSLVSTRGGDYEAAAWLDLDGDGFKSWEEFVAGTVPTNRDSVFNALITASNDFLRVGWTPNLGAARIYTVEGSASLRDAAWGPTNAQSRFFRVKVQLP